MSSCPALLINCMDPRLQGPNQEKIAAAAGFEPGQYECLAYGGPSLWLHDPHEENHGNTFWWTLKNVSIDYHCITNVVLVGHSSCGGFKLKGAPQEPAAEKSAIIASLQEAKLMLEKQYPQLAVKLVFVTIDEHHGEGLPNISCELI